MANRDETRSKCGPGSVFIGHGRSRVWKELALYLFDRLKLDYVEFNRVSAAGVPNTVRLEEMLGQCSFAFFVLTGEDEQDDGVVRARQNVVHEAGLFQGRLGFRRAIVLLEQGCESFSNIEGLGHITFPKGRVEAAADEIRKVLEREGLIASPSTKAAQRRESPPATEAAGSIDVNSPSEPETKQRTDLEEWGSSYSPVDLELAPESNYSNRALFRVGNKRWRGFFNSTVDFSRAGQRKVQGCWLDSQVLDSGSLDHVMLTEVQDHGDYFAVRFLESGRRLVCRSHFERERAERVLATHEVSVKVNRAKPPVRDASDEVPEVWCYLQVSSLGRLRLIAKEGRPDVKTDQIRAML